MPLQKSASKQAFKDNIRAEVRAGKPLKQSLAIAYSQQRAAKNKSKKKSKPSKVRYEGGNVTERS